MKTPRRSRIDGWRAAALALCAAGLAAALPFLLPFETVKPLADLLAKDGSLELFSFERYRLLQPLSLAVGLILIAGGLLLAWRRESARRMAGQAARWLGALARQLRLDAARFQKDLRGVRLSKPEGIALAIILLVALALRIAYLPAPMRYDEGYTYIEFARYSPWQVLTDYHVPNNHVLHTLLVLVSTRLFGGDPWAIRLPALLSGLLLVPAVFLLGKKTYGARAAVLASALTAVMPLQVMYSTNGRGYTLQALLAVVMFLLAMYVARRKNLAGWLLLILTSAAGLYTLPTTLYPLAMLLAWLFAAGLAKDIDPAYGGMRRWILILVVFTGITGALTVILYAPIFIYTGIGRFLFALADPDPLTLPQLIAAFPRKMLDLQYFWEQGFPLNAMRVLLAGSFLSLAMHRRLSKDRVPWQGAALVTLAVLLTVQHPNWINRIWLFLAGPFFIWGSAGLVGLFEVAAQKARGLRFAPYAALAGGLVVAGWVLWGQMALALANPELISSPDANKSHVASLYIKDHLRDGDIVIASADLAGFYWYYFFYDGIPEDVIRQVKNRPFQRAFIIRNGDTPISIKEQIVEAGPDLDFIDLNTLRLEQRFGETSIYLVEANHHAVEEEFGLAP